MRWMKLVVVTLLVPIAACSHAVKGQSSLAYADTQKVPLPPLAEEYRIQPGDQLEIKFFYNPSLNEQVTVRPDGLISLQLIKSIEAAGSTPEQLTDRLKKEYSTQLKEPDIVRDCPRLRRSEGLCGRRGRKTGPGPLDGAHDGSPGDLPGWRDFIYRSGNRSVGDPPRDR